MTQRNDETEINAHAAVVSAIKNVTWIAATGTPNTPPLATAIFPEHTASSIPKKYPDALVQFVLQTRGDKTIIVPGKKQVTLLASQVEECGGKVVEPGQQPKPPQR